jgi:DNA-binding transcriptional regulator YiaG
MDGSLYHFIGNYDIGFFDLTIFVEMFSGDRAVWVQQDEYKIVGAALAAARQRANITQVELARRLGKPQSFVSAFEAGKRRVDVVEFLLIVRTVGADPVEIFAEIVASISRETRAARL